MCLLLSSARNGSYVQSSFEDEKTKAQNDWTFPKSDDWQDWQFGSSMHIFYHYSVTALSILYVKFPWNKKSLQSESITEDITLKAERKEKNVTEYSWLFGSFLEYNSCLTLISVIVPILPVNNCNFFLIIKSSLVLTEDFSSIFVGNLDE